MEKRVLEGLHGNYKLGELLERTDWYNVYRAFRKTRRPFQKEVYAAKQITLHFDTPHEKREMLTDFGLLIQHYFDLDHPNLARVVDHLNDGIFHYTVYEFIPGLRLAQLLERNHVPVEEELVLFLAAEGASALQYLHNHTPPLIFGDLSPASIIISRDGTACLTDYGLARHLVKRPAHAPLLGTAGYAAPEQYGADARLAPACDVYAFGAVLWNAVSLRHPEGMPLPLPPVRHIQPQASEWMEEFIARCTEVEPARRFPSMESVLDYVIERDPSLVRFTRRPTWLGRMQEKVHDRFPKLFRK